jgi:hypothetical protein
MRRSGKINFRRGENMGNEDGASVTHKICSSATAELVGLSDVELRMMLVEWKRWRARVQTAPTMRLRRQRFDQATAYIEAIELELALREPEERFRRRRHADATLRQAAETAPVSLAAYRVARRDLARIEQYRP